MQRRSSFKATPFKPPRTISRRPASIVRARSLPSAVSTSYKFTQRAKELDFVDTAIAAQAISTTPFLVLLNGLAPGTGDNQRLGRRIQMKSIELKGYIQPDTATTTSVERFAIVQDMQPNAAAPTFAGANDGIYDAATPIALRNISNKSRFKVLWDSGLITNVSTVTAPTASNAITTMEHYRKIDIPVQYNAGTAGTIADIQTNSLYFVGIGNIAAGTGDVTLVANIRIRYDDV